MKQAQWIMESQLGLLYLVASEQGLLGVFWKKQSAPLVESLRNSKTEIQILSQAVVELDEYFHGQRKKFELPLQANGTSFQKIVWDQLRKIPYGETCSYREIAHRIKNEKAVRAVGTANGKNPLSIIIPCHRVIAADGSMGGYSGGLAMKAKLLELEQRNRGV